METWCGRFLRRSDLATLAAAALVLYTVATRNGMSVWPDTVAYRGMAEAIRAGSDPGPNFPKDVLLADVTEFLTGVAAPPVTPPKPIVVPPIEVLPSTLETPSTL